MATNGVTSWSFSRYTDYKSCPAKFKYKHIDKLKEPPNAAMERGTAVHKLAENYLKGVIRAVPTALKLMADQFKALKAQKLKSVEEDWAFTASWGETRWDDWTGCWLRVKVDASYIVPEHSALVPIDFKTGRPREDKNAEYEEQLELYSLGGLLKQPEIQVVSPRLWYVDHGVVHPDPEVREIEYTRDDVPALKKKWLARVKPMFNDRTFKPTPGDACRWCHFRKSNGGPCKY